MTSKDFKEKIVVGGFSIVNEFKNAEGDTFFILQSKFLKGYFIATSKNDYQIMELHRSGEYASIKFSFNKRESATIKKVFELIEKNDL